MKPLLSTIVYQCIACLPQPTEAEREVDWEAAERMYRQVAATKGTGT